MRIGERTTWILFTAVVLTAVSTLLPRQDPALPGVIRLHVLSGPGPAWTEKALRPLAVYLGERVRRSVQIKAVEEEVWDPRDARAHLLLAPVELLPRGASGYEVLAWLKGPGVGSAHQRPFVVFARSPLWHRLEKPRIILGDAHTWAGGRGAAAFLAEKGHPLPDGFAEVATGVNPYDHAEALAALAHGAYDLAVARESDVRRALAAGLLDEERWVVGPAGPPGGGVALLATPTLGENARRRVREALLELDHLRFDQQHLRAATVLEGLGLLGLEGFAPDEVLPSLRP
jgi:hypothetical protein